MQPTLRNPAPALAGLLCVLLALLLPSARAQVAAPVDDDDSVLVLGRVSDDPKSHYDQLKPLLDYVVPRMASVGIRSGRILMAKDLQQMTSYLRRGQVDWINETAGNAGLLERRGVARSLLITEREGATRYHGVFFVRRDSPVRTLADLAGRSVAFQNPYSTSAYYLPAAKLLLGIRLQTRGRLEVVNLQVRQHDQRGGGDAERGDRARRQFQLIFHAPSPRRTASRTAPRRRDSGRSAAPSRRSGRRTPGARSSASRRQCCATRGRASSPSPNR